jgi:putative transposase
MKAYKFRIYPSKTQEKEMRRHLWIAKELWNKMLEATIKRYDKEKKFYSKSELQLMVKNSGLYAQTAQGVAHKLDRALKAKIRMKKKGEKGGFPRFKSFDRMKSLNYPQVGRRGVRLDKKLKVTPFGEINIKQHREIEGKIKTLTIKRVPSGKWFAVFCVEQEPKQPKINNGEQVGIDLGLKTFATLSNGIKVSNPRHLKKYEDKLAFLQRRVSKKKRGSRNKRKANLRVERLHEKIANTRKDFLHKTTTSLINLYSLIALEKLTIPEMVEQQFGKQINDAGWGLFANMLRYKAESAGCEVVFVNPKNTTQECSGCHEIVKKDLTVRTHDCPNCGLVIDRDLNAAINILARATVGQTESNASGDEPIGSPLKEEAHTI